MIHIIGAGWYGCVIADHLRSRNHKIAVWEREMDIFGGASSYNQNRLHLGFHYPRCSVTRRESREGFSQFKKEYPELSRRVSKNIYGVSDDSIIDYETYLSIFKSENYNFTVESPATYGLNEVRGAISVDEEVIDHIAARDYWIKRQLPINLNEQVFIQNGLLYSSQSGNRLSRPNDLIIDCTWGECQPNNRKYYEEYFLSIVIKRRRNVEWGAITLMDGPFFSIYPYCGKDAFDLFTLTHVSLCPMKTKTLSSAQIKAICDSVFSAVSHYYPQILDDFDFVDSFVSRKLKPISRADSRSVGCRIDSNIMNVYAGKIDAVFFAVDIVNKWLEEKLK